MPTLMERIAAALGWTPGDLGPASMLGAAGPSTDQIKTLMSRPAPAAGLTTGPIPGIGAPAAITPARPPGRAPITPDSRSMELGLGFDPTVSPVTLPPPPQMEMPAGVQVPPLPNLFSPIKGGGINPAEYKKLLDQARPDPSEHLAAVLGGLARGAGSVDATKPGSFAAALAASGGGGMEGFKGSAQDMRAYLERRAAHELDIQKFNAGQGFETQKFNATHAMEAGKIGANYELEAAKLKAGADMQKTQISYNNAQAMYENTTKNMLAVQEAQMKNREMQMPKVQHDANGITVSRIDPNTKSVKVDFKPTKDIMDKAENLVSYFKALGMPGPAAEAEEVQFLQKSAGGDAILANELLRKAAASRVIQNGAGPAVFKEAYTDAAKKAQAILQQENPTLAAKPDEYQVELNKRVLSILMANPSINHPGWLNRAAEQRNIAAMIMMGIPVAEAVGGTGK